MIQLQRIAFDHPQLSRKRLAQFGKRGQAATIHLDRRDARAGTQQGACQPSGARPDFQHLLA